MSTEAYKTDPAASTRAVLTPAARAAVASLLQGSRPSDWRRIFRVHGLDQRLLPANLWRKVSGDALEYAIPTFMGEHGHVVTRKEASAEYKDLVYNNVPLELKTHFRGVWDSVRPLRIYESLGTSECILDTPHLVLKKRQDDLGFVEVEFLHLWEFLGLNEAGEFNVHKKNGAWQNTRPVISKERRFKSREECVAALTAFIEAHGDSLR